MGEGTDAVRESTPRSLQKIVTGGGDDPRAPWWAAWVLKALMIVGIPGALLGSREYQDFRYKADLIAVEKQRVAVDAERNAVFKELVSVLYKMNRKLPDEFGR